MASWDPAIDEGGERSDLRCLACGRPLDEALAAGGSLRCLDCRESNAVLNTKLMLAADERRRERSADVPSDLPLE